MPFGKFLKKLFKKGGKDVAGKYLGEDAANAVDGLVDQGFDQLQIDEKIKGLGGEELVGVLMKGFSFAQQNNLQELYSSVSSGDTSVIAEKATEKGLDPSLVDGVMNMLKGNMGSAGGAAGGGGGFDLGQLLAVVSSLTQGGSSGGGGANGFMNLIMGVAGGQGGGGGSGGAANSNNIMNVIMGLAKSFFNTQGRDGKNPALADWGAAGTGGNNNQFLALAMNLIKDLIFPGKKAKDMIDEDPKDKPTPGGKSGVKGWFDNHPEIGKMQKDVFDDVFDITDDDDPNRVVDDPTPLIPTPKGFQEDCSILDHASILFLNTKVLLDLRKEWRFCYSTKTNGRDFDEFFSAIELKGPTLVIIQDGDGNVFGAFTSTSWADSEGGWLGNGDTFIFALKPTMAVFYSTGKDDNIMYASKSEGLGLGGRIGRFGLSVSNSLEKGTYHADIETFDLGKVVPSEFTIEHIEVWALGPETDPSTERSKLHVRKPNLQIQGGSVDMDDLMGQIS